MIDKAESRRIRSEIREILLRLWDPIGVKNEPLAQDEYDAYIGGIFSLLTENASEEELKVHLWKIIEERIQVHPHKGATDDTVKALKSVRLS
jgi:hypothetical protein